MKTSTKAVLVIGGGVGAFFLIRALRQRRANVLISELNMVDAGAEGCNCNRTTRFKDGTFSSVRVSLDECAKDPDLAALAERCRASRAAAATGGLDE